MRCTRFPPVALSFALLAICTSPHQPSRRHPRRTDKIPITTSSEEARKLYLQGRDLSEKLRATDARKYFEQAAAKDKDFALAYLGLANTAGTAKEFFEAVAKGAALAPRVSAGEAAMLRAIDAAAKGDVVAQGRHLDELVKAFPNDERAQTLFAVYHFGRQNYAKAIDHFNEGHRDQPQLLAALQPARLRQPLPRQVPGGRSGVQEVHRADPERSEPLRFLRGAAHEDGALRRVDQDLREGARDRPELHRLARRHRQRPDVPGQGRRRARDAQQARQGGAQRRRAAPGTALGGELVLARGRAGQGARRSREAARSRRSRERPREPLRRPAT